MKNELIAFAEELQKLEVTVKSEKGLLVNPEFEEVYRRIKYVADIAENLEKQAKAMVMKQFDQFPGMDKFEGSLMSFTRVDKPNYKLIGDPEAMLTDPELAQFVEKAYAPNKDAIKAYEAAHCKTPDGVEKTITSYPLPKVVK